jgi:serine protease Do
METRKSTYFYGVLIALASLVAGMVLAARLDLSPLSSAGSLTVPAANSAPISGPLDATTFRKIADAASPSVVSISATSMRRARAQELPFGFEQFGGRQPRAPQRAIAAGSGFIIDKEGFILTNNHVVQDATSIEVRLAGMVNEEPGLPAKLVGRDPLTDSALLQLVKLPDEELVAAKFGDSSQLGPGDWVMAIGNPFRLSHTVTVGVVSAVGRQQQTALDGRQGEMIQTDAAINQGNSGGPLLNLRGEVVGINTMIASDGSGSFLGIGFAVPINHVAEILPQLHKGKVVRGLIGLGMSNLPITREDAKELGLPGSSGATISSVNSGGPGDKAGLRIGDVIVEYNGKAVKDYTQLVGMVMRTEPGTTVPVKIVRAKKPLTLNVTIDAFDAERQLAQQNEAEPPVAANAPTDTSLDMTIGAVTAEVARQLELPAGKTGAVVREVDPTGVAARGGLRPGDLIVGVNDVATTSVSQVNAALERVPSGRLVRLQVWRGGRQGAETLVQIRKP